jgi:hypothetical protein
MRRNACLETVIRELNERGIPYEVIRFKKHWGVRWIVIAHRPRTMTVPNDPGEWNAWINTRAQVRRMLKRDGIS